MKKPAEEIGKRVGRKLLSGVACVVKPATILGWYWRLIARKFDGQASFLSKTTASHLWDRSADRPHVPRERHLGLRSGGGPVAAEFRGKQSIATLTVTGS